MLDKTEWSFMGKDKGCLTAKECKEALGALRWSFGLLGIFKGTLPVHWLKCR